MSGAISSASTSTTLATTAFTDAERVDIRRFCGYPVYGPGASGFNGWRFFQAYGALEYRVNNMAPSEYQVVRQYLGNLYTLESAILGSGDNLDTDAASVWTHNRNEVRDRTNLFDGWRKRLCGYLGVPAGPELAGQGSGRIVI